MSPNGQSLNLSIGIFAEFVAALIFPRDFNTIFYYAPNASGDCHMEKVLENGIPVLIWRSRSIVHLQSFISEELLVMACLQALQWRSELQGLAQSLNFVRQAKIIIEMDTSYDKDLANAILTFCLQQDMINADMIFSDFAETRIVYVFEAFPSFAMKKQEFVANSSWLYPNKMLDLKGYGLRTLPDLSEPNTILYHDANGQPRLLGYVWDMVKEYACKRNAHLKLISKPVEGKTLTHIQLMDLARDRSLDIAASVQPMTLRYQDRTSQYAYPVHCSSWCTMIPMEQGIELRDLYAWTVPVQTMIFLGFIVLMHQLLHNRWLRLRRLQAIGWLVLAALLSLNFKGRILGLFVVPPLESPIDSFQAMASSKVRIFGNRAEYNSYDFDMRTKFSTVFRLSDSPSELIRLRNSLNISYAYTVTHTKWQLYAEQQAHSSRPLFRYSTDLCYYEMTPFALVIPENSPHRAPLHSFTLAVVESGLFDHWVAKSFYYMVEAGRLHMKDLFPERQAHSVSLNDLIYVLQSYLVGMASSVVLFLLEICVSWALVSL
ncbi:uncharacterized protein [Drosophila tropicalis]|uniref:uncharacterized protein n=1 Tax=Drosophila tropicalis TaxID=46794 RepID=UPI0035ABF8B5